MLKANERVQKINEARKAQEENVPTDTGPVEDNGPQVAGEATSAMNDVLDLHQNNDNDGPSLQELVSSLNADQARVYERVKSHLEHQLVHEKSQCKCTDFRPLHMFVSGVGGTGKSFLIKTIRALLKCGRTKHGQHCVPSLLPLDWLHSTLVVSPSIGCCSCPLSTKAEELATGS
jgi:hypothetical protein